MRRGLRRQYRLVRVEVHGRRLNVLTGTRNNTAPRACARARTGAGGFGGGALETLRRLAFSLAGGLFSVSGGRRGAMARGARA